MTRTCDLLVRSQTLYPTELRARFFFRLPQRAPTRYPEPATLGPSRDLPARTVAFDIRCWYERGGYASDLLLTRAAALDTRDAGLASELVFGSLRYQGQLDFLFEHFSGRQRLDLEIRIALRLASTSFGISNAFPPMPRFQRAWSW